MTVQNFADNYGNSIDKMEYYGYYNIVIRMKGGDVRDEKGSRVYRGSEAEG